MARLIYAIQTSLDGYIADEDDNFDWPLDEELNAFVNELERPVGTYLYGRRMYEAMRVWEGYGGIADLPPSVKVTPRLEQLLGEFAGIWRAADKIVYSRTLEQVSTARTRVERHFDPETVRQLKDTAARDLTIGGAELAAAALQARLVDDCHFFLHPVAVGGGSRALPDHLRLPLTLVDEHRFGSGAVRLHYRVAG